MFLAHDGDGGYAKGLFARRTPAFSWQPGELEKLFLQYMGHSLWQ